MAELRPEIEWARPHEPRNGVQLGMRERFDDKWEVLKRVAWWEKDTYEVVVVVDSRDAAIGFIKLLGV